MKYTKFNVTPSEKSMRKEGVVNYSSDTNFGRKIVARPLARTQSKGISDVGGRVKHGRIGDA